MIGLFVLVTFLLSVISFCFGVLCCLPKLKTDGTIFVTTENEENGVVMGIKLDRELNEDYYKDLKSRKTITFRVK